jgi:tight adherence protein B
MERTLLPILVASASALLAWALVRLALDLAAGEKRRLADRLRSDLRGGEDVETLSVRLSGRDDGLARLFGSFSVFREFERSLLQAYPDTTPQRFLSIMAGCGAGAFVVFLVISASWVVALLAGSLGAGVPLLAITARRTKRQKLMVQQLPDSLDFLARALRAGHSFSTGLQLMGDELPEPIAAEFRRAYERHSVGLPLEQCLRDMVDRFDSSDFAFFVTATLIQRQTGGDLSEVLRNIAAMLRQRIRLQQHVRAKTAEGRFTGYVLSAFPVLMFVVSYVLNPNYAGQLLQSGTGIALLTSAMVMALLGLLMIRKLTTLKV